MIIQNLCLSFGNHIVFDDFSLEYPDNKITCILGPSGCGKTTLLNTVAGLLIPDSGKADRRDKVSYLFQEPRLLPWKTVLENVAIPLKGDYESAKKALYSVGLEDFIHNYPADLSGGMKQRVAIARAFSYPSEVILMDEPFQSLDVRLSNRLMNEFLKIWNKDRKTVLWVTHNITEACFAADKVIVVDSNPMHKVLELDIKINREERNTQNCAGYYSEIFQALTNQ